jgi:hypothetical protein
MSFAAITLCVASQRVSVVVSAHFVIYSVRKLLVTLSYPNDWYNSYEFNVRSSMLMGICLVTAETARFM